MEDFLELLQDEGFVLTNAQSKTIAGEEYIVAEAVILREGILNGSEGPLYYSEEEITKRPGMWNGVTVTAPHPFVWDGGRMKFISINSSPDVNGQFAVGKIYNDRVEKGPDGKSVRKVDVHFNVAKANRVDGRIVPSVLAGEPTNLSTGIYTEKRKAVDNAKWNGREYTHSVHNISPDHLAILMDEKGACSVSDGCGINVNADQLSKWTKEEVVAVTLYNRDWPKDKRAALSKSSPEDFAGPHQSFPIQTQADVDAAARLIGHADDPAAVKTKIIAIAKRKGLKIPTSWEGKKATHNSDTSDLELEFPTTEFVSNEPIVPTVINAWTNAARAASLAARRKSHSALNKDKKLRGGKGIRRAADSAISHHGVGDFKKVHAAHGQAMRAHGRAMKAASRRGDHAIASAHSDAAAAHRAAKSMYSKRMTHNSKKMMTDEEPPEVCPSCGGSMDSNGKCTECGYESNPVSNSEGKMKEELVSWLVANCDCWKEKGSDTVLNNLSEGQLKQLKANALKATFTDVSTGIIKKIGKQVGFDPKADKGGYNNLPDFIANAMKDPDDMDDGDDDPDVTNADNDDDEFVNFNPTTNKKNKSKSQKTHQEPLTMNAQVEAAVKQVFKNMTVDQWKDWAPEPVREVFNTAEKAHTERKVAIINALTKGIEDQEQRKAEILNLRKKKLPELEEIAKYAGVNGSGGTPTANANESEDDRFLRLFFKLGKGGTAGNGNGGGSVNNTQTTDDGLLRIGNMTLNTKDVLVPSTPFDEFSE